MGWYSGTCLLPGMQTKWMCGGRDSYFGVDMFGGILENGAATATAAGEQIYARPPEPNAAEQRIGTLMSESGHNRDVCRKSLGGRRTPDYRGALASVTFPNNRQKFNSRLPKGES